MTYSNIRKNIITSIAIGVAFVLAITVNPLSAQVFPVQANINVTPPYTVYLSHYTAPDQQRVMASVLLHDPVVTSLDVRFRFTIEGAGIRLYTNPGWIPAPFTLRSGITELISADIIAEYFRPQNVIAEGINPQELFRKGKLPEGFYQFKIEVLEYQRGVPISNIGRTGVWLLLSEPPRVVFPTPNQKVNATNPQILNFTWVPGGVASPLSALSTMYEFTLVELMGEVDPTVAITTASDAIKFTRTQQQTTLLYGPGEPQLTPGKSYAYRVRAYNTDGYELFKNNGYSEVGVFQFGDACNTPAIFTLKDETQSTFSIDVVADPGSDAWQAQFRESGDESGQWSELKAEPGTSTKTVKGLKASTTYQVQLKSLCGTVSSSYTTPQTITTKEKVNTQRSCENSVSPFVVSQAQPLQQLKPNDIFLAALMPIKVTEVTNQGGGKFTGKGIATVPLFSAGLAVHFTDIGINELMQLTAGEVVVERNAVNVNLFGDTDPTGNGSTTGNGTATDTTGNDGWPEFTDTINISSDIDSVVVVNDTTVWVYTSGGGEPVIVDMGGSDCLLIVPADGNMDNAQVVYNGAAKPYSAGSGSTSDTDEQYTGFRARFAPALNTQYGFDSLRVQAYANQYNDLEIDGKTYKLPWKALPVNIPDPVTLHIRRSADSYPYSDLKVGVLGGNDLLPTAGANTATQTYNLTGTTAGDQYAVVATYDQDGKRKYAGGLWAATYQPKVHKLYIVPLPGVKVPADTIEYLQNGLTQIYSQAVVSWTVQPLNGFTGVELGDNGLDWADKDMLSTYNAEMNSVISAFKDWKADADPDAYYLFVVPKFSESGVEGFMPRNRRFGFVTLSQLDARLVAHEIGHGAFNLRHTFPEVAQGSTDNLMDYPPAGGQAAEGQTSLLKLQWDLIHNPETTTGLFDDMEDGASTTTPVNDAWTALFNHIQNDNNSLQHSYLDKISKESEDFNLNQDPDNLKWSQGTRDFMSKWKIRALDINKDKPESNFVSTNELNAGSTLNKIFDAIRIANDGEKIGKIELRPKKIYLGKLEFKGKEYFFALYGNGTSTTLENVFTKRQVETITDLEDKTHVYSIYCDDTPNNYMIIGFLESGKSEPSMAIQISKAGLTDWLLSKEDWLENLNIYKPNDKKQTDGLLTLYNGDNEVKDPVNFFPTITATPDPAMPKNLKIKFNGSTGEKANITVKISYRITYSYDGKTYPFDDGNTTIEIKDAEANKLYPLAFTSIRGGTVTVTCETTNKKGTLKFNIRGENPSESDIKKYLSEKRYSTKYWFFNDLTRVESGFKQFCYNVKSPTFAIIDETKTYDGPYTSSAGQKGLPFYGGPKGFGLKQLDNWGANKYCSGEQRWNWKQNVDGGYEVLESKLDAKGNYDLRYYLNQIINKLKADKNVKLEMKDFTIGNYTFTLGNNTTYFPSYDLKITVPDGKYSFLVAALIKMYNGGSIIESLTEHVEKEVNNETGDIVDVKYLKINIDTNSTTDNSDKTKRPYLFKVLDPK